MTKQYDRMTQGRLTVIERALKLPRAKHLPSLFVRRVFFNVWLHSAWLAAVERPRKAMAWYMRALRYAPLDPRPYKGLVKCCLGRA
jgi:hypothetical protein